MSLHSFTHSKPHRPPTLPGGLTYELLDTSRRHFHELIGNVVKAPPSTAGEEEEEEEEDGSSTLSDASLPKLALSPDAIKFVNDVNEGDFGANFEFFPLAFMVDGEEGEP